MKPSLILACIVATTMTAFGQEISGTVIKLEGPGGEAPVFAPRLLTSNSLSFYGGLPDDPIGMLQRPQIQKEIGLSEDQVTIVKELQQDIQRQMAEIFQSQAKFGGDAGRLMGEANKAIRKNIEKELANILKPKQVKRLKELEVQLKLKNRGALALLDDKMSSQLEMSDEQKKDLKKQQGENQKELRAEIQKLRAKYRDELIKDVLTKTQLRKLEDLSGEDYHVQTPNWRRAGLGKDRSKKN